MNEMPPKIYTENPETARLEAHLEHVRGDIGEMKSAINDMAKAIQTLTAVETKQAEHGDSIRRAFGEISDVRSRVKTLELQQPLNKQTQSIVNKAIEVVLIAVLGGILSMILFK